MSSPVADDTSHRNIRILVVDDVDFNLEILTGILAERGWQTVTATSGEAALDRLARDHDFQIILMDIGLPGISGIETTRRIKQNPACRDIPVIALTAETATEQERLLAAGLDGYTEKNFDPDQLFATIDRHLLPPCRKRYETGVPATVPAEDCDLDFEKLLATYTDKAILARIARAFFTDTDKELRLLDEAMAAGNQDGILACCHSLRGSAAIFTAKKLATTAKELDSCIRLGKKNAAESAWLKVQAAHASLRNALASRLGPELPCD